jgi:uncharacterized protein
LLSGNVPRVGTRAGMSGTYSPDPMAALGLSFSEVAIPTELGPAPAWLIPADPKAEPGLSAGTWVITVHGSSADRKQSLKFVPVLHRAGLSVLDITYRNDIGAPRSSDGLMHLGESEWRDLDAAVRTALSMGARHLVLYGGSMGGAIVLQFLANSPLADRVSAVLLEAPMLSVPRMIDNLGHVHHMPAPLTWTALKLTNWRLGFDVHQIDALRFPRKVHPPTLVLSGYGRSGHAAFCGSRFRVVERPKRLADSIRRVSKRRSWRDLEQRRRAVRNANQQLLEIIHSFPIMKSPRQ